MEAVIVKPAGRDTAEPAVELIAGRDQGDGFLAARAHRFTEREHRGHHRGAAVHDRFVVGVVEVLRVRLGAVGERRRRCRGPLSGRDQTGAASGPETARRRMHRPPHRRAGATDDEAQGVEDPQLDVGDHPLGKILVPQSEGPLGEVLAQADFGHDLSRRRSGLRVATGRSCLRFARQPPAASSAWIRDTRQVPQTGSKISRVAAFWTNAERVMPRMRAASSIVSRNPFSRLRFTRTTLFRSRT